MKIPGKSRPFNPRSGFDPGTYQDGKRESPSTLAAEAVSGNDGHGVFAPYAGEIRAIPAQGDVSLFEPGRDGALPFQPTFVLQGGESYRKKLTQIYDQLRFSQNFIAPAFFSGTFLMQCAYRLFREGVQVTDYMPFAECLTAETTNQVAVDVTHSFAFKPVAGLGAFGIEFDEVEFINASPPGLYTWSAIAYVAKSPARFFQ